MRVNGRAHVERGESAAPENRPFFVCPGAKVHVHPTSALHHSRRSASNGVEIVTFNEKIKTSQVFLREATLVSPCTLLLFAADIEVRHHKNQVCVDNWILLHASAKTAVIFKELRKELNIALERKLREPEWDFHADPFIAVVVELLARAN